MISFMRVFFLFLICSGTLLAEPFERVVIWGHKLHTHKHSYIHNAFYRAFGNQGFEGRKGLFMAKVFGKSELLTALASEVADRVIGFIEIEVIWKVAGVRPGHFYHWEHHSHISSSGEKFAII